MYHADLRRLHETSPCSSCGETILAERWAYSDGDKQWHLSCRAPFWLAEDDLPLEDGE